jgi:uncharacterized MAPEG superfamily protein
MTIAYWCVCVMIFFPYIFTVMAKWSNHYDNHDPRGYLANTTGWRQRANYVQVNCFEAVPAFGIAVIIAHLAQAQQSRIDMLALTFVVCRVVYGFCYVTDRATMRTIIWFIGLFSVAGLFVAAAAS